MTEEFSSFEEVGSFSDCIQVFEDAARAARKLAVRERSVASLGSTDIVEWRDRLIKMATEHAPVQDYKLREAQVWLLVRDLVEAGRKQGRLERMSDEGTFDDEHTSGGEAHA